MAADVEQDDFLPGDGKREGNPVTVGEAVGVAACEFAPWNSLGSQSRSGHFLDE